MVRLTSYRRRAFIRRRSRTWRKARPMRMRTRRLGYRRAYRLRYRKRRTATRLTQGLRPTMVTRCTWYHRIGVNPGVNEFVALNFNLMNPGNPDGQGNHAAMGFQDIALNYDRWKILGAKITLREGHQGNSNAAPYKWWLKLQNDQVNRLAQLDHYSTWLEQNADSQGNCLWTGNYGWATAGTNSITKYFSARKFFGMKTPIETGESYNGTGWVGPNIKCYLWIYGLAFNDTMDPGHQELSLKIDWIVKGFRKDMVKQRVVPPV